MHLLPFGAALPAHPRAHPGLPLPPTPFAVAKLRPPPVPLFLLTIKIMETLDDLLSCSVLSFLNGADLLTAGSVCKMFRALSPIAAKQRLRRINRARLSGGHRPARISASNAHTLCVREADGITYAWGGNTDGDGSLTPLALGVSCGEDQTTPCPIVQSACAGDSVREVAAGGYHSLFLTDSGRIFIAGSTLLIDNRDESLRLVRLPRSMQIVQVACGAFHCLALTDEGSLLSWGRDSDRGRLGHGLAPPPDYENFRERNRNGFWDCNKQVRRPRHVTTLKGIPIVEVSAGEDHSLCVSAAGGLYSWGDWSLGRLGLPLELPGPEMEYEQRFGIESELERWCSIPRLVVTAIQFAHVSAGQKHSLAVSAEGGLYAWGSAKSGQLGNAISGEDEDEQEAALEVREPTRVEGLPKVVMAAAGGRHSIVLGIEGAVYTFGAGRSGQLCLGDWSSRARPTRLPSFPASYGPAVEVAAGEETSFIRFGNDVLLVAGSNLSGQLGCGGPTGWDDGVERGPFVGPTAHSARPHCQLTPVAVAWP